MSIIGHSYDLNVPRLLQAHFGPFCVFLRSFLKKSTTFDKFVEFLVPQGPKRHGSGSPFIDHTYILLLRGSIMQTYPY